MKEITKLIPDIYSLIKSKDGGWFDELLAEALSKDLSVRLKEQFGPRPTKGSLRLSAMGARCPCALWYSVNHPELAQALPPWSEIKYAFGTVIEGLTIALAKAAGHAVEGEQDELRLDGIVGHRDCVIDGCIVDVKSAASRSFDKFKSRDFSQSDSFGYLDQLDGYVLASANDPLVLVKDRGYLLAVDKQLGHMCLYEHHTTQTREDTLRARIKTYKDIVSLETPPPCKCKSVAEGSSGNYRLDLKGSYNLFKYCCNPRVRTFIYSDGPKYFTKVVKKPYNASTQKYLKEVDKDGKVIYN